MQKNCSGVILAGGLNTRFAGREKALMTVGGMRILDRLYLLFRDIFEDIIIVSNEPSKYLEWDAHIVTDIFPLRRSLTGIHAGLYYCRKPYAFIAACDIPFLRKEVVETIIAALSEDIDVVIPETAAGLEPLCAAYSARCEEAISRQLQKNRLKIQLFFNKRRVRHISEKTLRRVDPQLISFTNINSPPDLIRAEAIWSAVSDTQSSNRT